MKRFSFRSLAAVALMMVSELAMASHTIPAAKSDPLSRMRKVERSARWSDPIGDSAVRKHAASHSASQNDDFQYIYAPDGTIWYATTRLDVETVELEGGFATEDLVKGYTFTIYDEKFNEVGSVHDQIRFEGDEYKCARVMLDVTLTKKFFNLDEKYEVMVAVCNNAPDYTVNTRTLVYTIGGEKNDDGCDKVLLTIPGYTIDAVDTSTDPWGENFFISFLTEKTPDPEADYPDYMDYLAGFSQVVTTYKKAGMNPEPSIVNVHETPNLLLPGDQMSSPMMLSKSVDGKLTLIFSQYEKSYFIDPTGMGGNEDATPDNKLLIDVYRLPSNSATEMQLMSSTVIPALQDADNGEVLYTFYGLGSFRYDKDVDFTHYTDDGSPAFVVTIDKYLLTDDDSYRSTYCIYDVEGKLKKTLAGDTYNILEMSDVPGQEPQMMFVYKGDEQMHFQFVDLYSGRIVTEIDQIQTGFVLSGSVDRVPCPGGYHYAISYAQGNSDEEGDTYALVGWFDTLGELERVDRINVGKDVQLAQIYIEGKALSPYVFNTDSDLEYMVLVKRGMGEDDENFSLREELLIVAPGKEPVRTFLPDEEKGRLAQIYLFGESEKMLVVSYIANHKVSADGYELPFTRFQGGEGTASSPYLIATAGDLQQIGVNPSAHYRLVADIDCGGESFSSVKDFSGSFDGGGHSINGLSLYGSDNVALFASAFKASFHDVDFLDPVMELEGSADAALLVGTATMCEIDNVNVYGPVAFGDDFRGTFGGIVGHLWSTSKITRSGVTKSCVRLPKAETVGGVVSEIRTGSVVDACVYSGMIEADNTVGGIVGSTTTGDETISNCRSGADIRAKHTVGGIVGYLNRSKVKNNFVEGSIEAYEPSKWTKALSLGGIAGELRADWEGTGSVPVVNNFVALERMSYPQGGMSESYPHQCSTVHRVVGRTVYNEEPEVTGYDDAGKPVYKDAVTDGGIYSNIVIDTLPVVDSEFAETGVEGTSITRASADETFLGEYGFAFGTTLDRPWRLANPGVLRLFFEKSLHIYGRTNVNVDDEVYVIVESVDILDSSYSLSYPEDMLQIIDSYHMEGETFGSSVIDSTCYIFRALKPGDAVVSATRDGETVEYVIHIGDTGAVEAVADAPEIKYTSGAIEASGCAIEVYSLSGMLVKCGADSLEVYSLPGGAYIAVAKSASGVKTLKFRR